MGGCVSSRQDTNESDNPTWATVHENIAEPAENNNINQEDNLANQGRNDDQAWINEYTIYVEINNPDSRIVVGDEKVLYKNRTGKVLEEIYFNVYLNAFNRNVKNKPYLDSLGSSVFTEGVIDYGYMDIVNVTSQNVDLEIELNETVLIVKLNEPLEVNEEIELRLFFDSYIPLVNHRTGANENAMWFGNFFPIIAEYGENGWNTEPYYPIGYPFHSSIANYNVTIVTPSNYTVVATGGGTHSDNGNKRTTSVTARMVRDFAFALSDSYEIRTIKTDSNRYINLYTYSQISDECKDEILEIAKRSIDYFSNIAGAHPSSFFDIVETRLSPSGVMGYPLIVFVDSAYIQNGSPYNSIANGIGRQWFYGLIGNNGISEPWLSDGLIAFLNLRIFYTDEQIMRMMEIEYETLAEQLAEFERTFLSDGLEVYGSWVHYVTIQSTRAKLMLYSLKLKMGEPKFYEAIRAYCSSFSNKIVTTEDFIATMENIHGKSLADFFDGWLNGETLPPLE